MTETEMRGIVAKCVEQAGGQRALAKLLKFTPAYINDVLHGRRAISDEFASRLGYKRTVIFSTNYTKRSAS